MTLMNTLSGAAMAVSRWPILKDITEREALETFRSNRDQNLFYGVYERWEDA